MTMDEASEWYNIPVEVLREYRKWGLCAAVKDVMGVWRYDDRDIERLSLIMTLHDIGFSNEEVEMYMRLSLSGDATASERLHMLDRKRERALDEIHFRQIQLDRMDYLRHEIRKVTIIREAKEKKR
ncbi:MAG: MerR family transcriptional regulator [Sphaerochaetaceae bacterium]|nr:MerR family transcriptional regulator [Sphaerochaetaceae bacterium]